MTCHSGVPPCNKAKSGVTHVRDMRGDNGTWRVDAFPALSTGMPS
jgi:hypothetical protein